MPLATVAELDDLARKEPGGRHDAYSSSALERSLDEYLASRRARIAPFICEVDGRSYPTILNAILDHTAKFEIVRLTLDHPPTAGTLWEYVPRFRELLTAPDGSALLYRMAGDKGEAERVIVRLRFREHYHPRSAEEDRAPIMDATPTPRPGLVTWPELAKFVRDTGVVPFALAVDLYGEDGRGQLDVDLVDSLLLPDVRTGRLPLSRRVRRSARASHGVDAYLGREEPNVIAAHALEVLFETSGLSAIDLTHVLGGLRELTTSALDGLRARGLVAFDKRTGIYRCRLDAFMSPEDRARATEEPLAPLPNPALRTSVMELLAAADSRATCPLCGDPLPPGHRGILCDRCTREVDATQSPAQ